MLMGFRKIREASDKDPICTENVSGREHQASVYMEIQHCLGLLDESVANWMEPCNDRYPGCRG
jgi:hypothetical protein